jgi:putative redox protein
MSVKFSAEYLGNLKVSLTHSDSGTTITTAAPKDNGGDGTSFSPTDLCTSALPACMLTIMALVAERKEITLSFMRATFEKIMSPKEASPRKIAAINLQIELPSSLVEKDRLILENAAHTCPVHYSLNPEIDIKVTFSYI